MKKFWSTLVRRLTLWAWHDELKLLARKQAHYEMECERLDSLLSQAYEQMNRISKISSKGSPQRAIATAFVQFLDKLSTGGKPQ